MSINLLVRPARIEDKSAIVAFCQNTFSWGDYVPSVFDDWLNDSSGQLLVGLIEEQPSALVHLVFLDDGVAWLEGMRVHPDVRKQGVGGVMTRQACKLASERECHLARLVTSMKNVAAQGMLGKHGFRRVAQFNEWETEPKRSRFSRACVGHSGDAMQIQSMWDASDVRAACHLLPDRRWRWTGLSESRVQRRLASGEVRLADGGFGMLLAFDEKDWNGLSLHALCGGEKTMRELAIAARGEARYRGYQHVEAQLIDHPRINAALENAGYRRTGGLFVYEQMLK